MKTMKMKMMKTMMMKTMKMKKTMKMTTKKTILVRCRSDKNKEVNDLYLSFRTGSKMGSDQTLSPLVSDPYCLEEMIDKRRKISIGVKHLL